MNRIRGYRSRAPVDIRLSTERVVSRRKSAAKLVTLDRPHRQLTGVDRDHGAGFVQEGQQLRKARVAEVDPALLANRTMPSALSTSRAYTASHQCSVDVGSVQRVAKSRPRGLSVTSRRPELDPAGPPTGLGDIPRTRRRASTPRRIAVSTSVGRHDFPMRERPPTREWYAAWANALVAQQSVVGGR